MSAGEVRWATGGPNDALTVREDRADAEKWAAMGADRGRYVLMLLTPDAADDHDRRVRAEALRQAANDIENGTVDHEDLRQAGVSDLAPRGWSDQSVIDAHNTGSVWVDWLRARADHEEATQ